MGDQDAVSKDPQGAAVEELYLFRDHFFERHDAAEASSKDEKVEQQLQECLKKLDDIEISETKAGLLKGSKSRAFSLYLRGRALNVTGNHSQEAENLLSRAVKLDPQLVEAWNELGECYCMRNDVDMSITCFNSALAQKPNKVSLRGLSIVLRLKPCSSQEERLRNIEQGLSKAHEAVQLDTGDGTSWTILGNAYLMHFFSVSQNPRTLKQAMSAYKQAEKDPTALLSPEYHYNKGVVLKYEEEYKEALSCFNRAVVLNPTWDKAIKMRSTLQKYLTDISHSIKLKGKLKTKRFYALIQSIDRDKHLGPIRTKDSEHGKGSSLRLVDLDDLMEGANEGMVVLGKVICSIYSEEAVPFTFCMADRTGKCVAVNLYNLAPGKGVIIGDAVSIVEPHMSHIYVEVEGKKEPLEFHLIRVNSPLTLVINGKRVSSDFQAGIELSTFTKND